MSENNLNFQGSRTGWVCQLRTLVSLARLSNLPTVWSNCLAGWWLGGHEDYSNLPWLFAGITALYLGGTFLNDAFDADVDRQHHPERAIPSGGISVAAVWSWGLAWLGLGAICLITIGTTTGVLAIILGVCIIVYDAAHKVVTASPWLMGVCRFWVYVIAGSAAGSELNGWPIWCGVVLALYVAGLGRFAQLETSRRPIPYWPLALLSVPVLLALIMNDDEKRADAMWVSLILILWLAYCIRPMFHSGQKNLSRIVSGLVAGIVWVDLLAVAPDCPTPLRAVFLVLFVATLLLQRFLPAT